MKQDTTGQKKMKNYLNVMKIKSASDQKALSYYDFLRKYSFAHEFIKF